MYNFLAQGLEMHTKPWVRARASKDYWEKMRPAGETKAGDYEFVPTDLRWTSILSGHVQTRQLGSYCRRQDVGTENIKPMK